MVRAEGWAREVGGATGSDDQGAVPPVRNLDTVGVADRGPGRPAGPGKPEEDPVRNVGRAERLSNLTGVRSAVDHPSHPHEPEDWGGAARRELGGGFARPRQPI